MKFSTKCDSTASCIVLCPCWPQAVDFRVGEIEIMHRPRKFGRSKYGMGRFVKGFLDLLTVKFLTGFGQRPQHILGSIGLASFFIGALMLVYLTGYWISRDLVWAIEVMNLSGRPSCFIP